MCVQNGHLIHRQTRENSVFWGTCIQNVIKIYGLSDTQTTGRELQCNLGLKRNLLHSPTHGKGSSDTRPSFWGHLSSNSVSILSARLGLLRSWNADETMYRIWKGSVWLVFSMLVAHLVLLFVYSITWHGLDNTDELHAWTRVIQISFWSFRRSACQAMLRCYF